MKSAIFSGQVRHRRMQPTGHEFVFRLFMMYLDLSELDSVFRHRWLWSTQRIALARFRRDVGLGQEGVEGGVEVVRVVLGGDPVCARRVRSGC